MAASAAFSSSSARGPPDLARERTPLDVSRAENLMAREQRPTVLTIGLMSSMLTFIGEPTAPRAVEMPCDASGQGMRYRNAGHGAGERYNQGVSADPPAIAPVKVGRRASGASAPPDC